MVVFRSVSGEIMALGSDQTEFRIASANWVAFVRDHETAGVRWVWDDTTRWYPELLAAGVRIRYCRDLRLTHRILRTNPEVDQTLFVDVEHWDQLEPKGEAKPALFVYQDESLDALIEFRSQEAALTSMADSSRMNLLLNAESSAALVAAEMTFAGLPWSTDIHEQLLVDKLGPRPARNARPKAMEDLLMTIRKEFADESINPDSPAELLKSLQNAGLPVTDTRQWTLERIQHPGLPALLEYKKLRRLWQANGWQWLEEWVHDGRYRTQFLPGGVVTGRWAAIGGGALSIPTQLKPAVVADEGWKFVVADVAQLEPRCLAGMSRDTNMATAAQAKDLYQGLIDAKAAETRADAKVGMLGAMYGATSGDSAKIVSRMRNLYPDAFGMVEAAAQLGEHGEVVQTFLGRGSPPGPDDRDRKGWGRFTRNFIVQGTGAEWAMSWMASLRNRLWAMDHSGSLTERAHLVFFVHDEVVVHTPANRVDEVSKAVREAAAEAGRLLFGAFPIDFPLDVAVVDNYGDAKK